VLAVQTDWYRPNHTKKKWYELDPITHLQLIEEAQHEIYHLAHEHKIDEFAIEDYVQYLGGGSTAKTIIPLAVLNMSLRMTIWRAFEIEPVPLSVMKVRHTLKTGKKLPAKEDIPNLLDKLLGRPVRKWDHKVNRRTKKRELTQEMYDVADAVAVGLAHIKIKSSPPKKKRSKKKRAKHK
jgi:hypothetical protein